MVWFYANWQKILMIIGGITIVIAGYALFKGKDASTPQPAPPHAAVVKVDTTQSAATSVIESKHEEKRRVKVRVIVPAETVIGGDSAMVIEIVVEDSSKSEAAVEDVKVEDKGLTESVTISNQLVVPVAEKERLIGIFAGAGYLPDGGIVPEVGISLHLYKLAYLQAGAGLDGVVFGFGGGALKIGEVFNLRILLGANYSTESKLMLTLSLGG